MQLPPGGRGDLIDLGQIGRPDVVWVHCPTFGLTDCRKIFPMHMDGETTLNYQNHLLLHVLVHAKLVPPGILQEALEGDPDLGQRD